MPPWIPQNIQKRLLLYVLQQLSLFSEIDLPNLEEVLLNNIVLRDVSLDPEKVGKLPGINFRSGQVGLFELTAGSLSTGGVTVDAYDVDVVVAPDVEEQVSQSVAFSLAQSTANLANTIIDDLMEDSDTLSDIYRSVIEDRREGSPLEKDKGKGNYKGKDNGKGNHPNNVYNTINNQLNNNLNNQSQPQPNNQSQPQLNNQSQPQPNNQSQSQPNNQTNTKNGATNNIKSNIGGHDDDSSDTSDSPGSPRPSALSGVMARAVEMALLRLHVNVHRIKLKVIADTGDLLVEIATLGMRTVNGVRRIDLGDIKVSTLADVQDGEKQNETEEDDKTDRGDDSDNDDESDVSSSPDASLMNSMVFTHEEASLIYMSATSKSLYVPPARTPPVILHTDTVCVEFKGLLNISSLKVEVGNVLVASTPLLPTITTIMDGVTRALKIKQYQKRRASRENPRFPQYHGDDSVETEQKSTEDVFHKAHIESVQVSTSSAIVDGKFQSDSMVLFLRNVNIKNKPESIYGGAETVGITNNGKRVFWFEGAGAAKADLRFEAFRKDSGVEFTVLCSKEARVVLDARSVARVADWVAELEPVVASIKSWGSLLEKKSEGEFLVVFQAGALNGKLDLGEIVLVLEIAPVAFENGKMKLDEVKLLKFRKELTKEEVEQVKEQEREEVKQEVEEESKDQDAKDQDSKEIKDQDSKEVKEQDPKEIKDQDPKDHSKEYKEHLELEHLEDRLLEDFLILHDIELLTTPAHFRSFMVSPRGTAREASLTTPVSLTVDEVSISENNFNDLERMFAALASHILHVERLQKHVPKRAGVLQMEKSVFARRRGASNGVCSMRVHLKHIRVSVEIPEMGLIDGHIRDVCLKWMQGKLVGSVLHAQAVRGGERFMGEYQGHTSKTLLEPMVMLREENGTIEVTGRNFLVEVGEREKENEENNDGEEREKGEKIEKGGNRQKNDSTTPSSSSTSSRLRIVLVDCVVGVTPRTLSAKSYIAIDRGHMDVGLAYTKATLKGVHGYLIDDIANESSGRADVIPGYVSPGDFYVRRGYVRVVTVNVVHVAVTQHAGTLDVKINLEEQKVEVCADSANCLILMMMDMRPEVVLADDQKMKVRLGEDVNLLEDVDDVFGKGREGEDEGGEGEGEEGHKSDGELEDTWDSENVESHSGIDTFPHFDENHFDHAPETSHEPAQARIHVSLGLTKLYLFDGYDWGATREAIAHAVEAMEEKLATKRKRRAQKSAQQESSFDPLKSPLKDGVDSDLTDSVEFLDLADSGDFADSEFLESGELDSGELEPGKFLVDSGEYESDSDSVEENLFESIFVGAPTTANRGDIAAAINRRVRAASVNVDVGKVDLLSLRRSSAQCVVEVNNVEVSVEVYEKEKGRREGMQKERGEIRERKQGPLNDKEDSGFPSLLNTIEVSVETVTILDNVATSLWHTVLGYDGARREVGTQMVKARLTNVRASHELIAGEAILQASIMPLRVYLDQDTLMFIQRFIGFRDARFEVTRADEEVYFEKIELDALRLRVDYKPKNVDYVGIRGGRYAELLNFFSLEGLEIHLDGIALHGVGASQLGDRLATVWGDSFVRNKNSKIVKILIGFGLFRLLYTVGGDLRDLVVVPMRSDDSLKAVQKHGARFLRSAGMELVRLGVKLSTGTQGLLEQGESRLKKGEKKGENRDKSRRKKKPTGVLETSQILFKRREMGGKTNKRIHSDYLELDHDLLEPDLLDPDLLEQSELLLKKPVSNYLNQPANVEEGLQHAYAAVGKNVKATKRHVMRLLAELEDAETVQETARVVMRRLPLLLLRPMIGTTEAVLKALMGLGNNIDARYLEEARSKYGEKRE